MSSTEPAKKYGALSAEQKEIIANQRVDAQHTPGEWVSMLGDLAAFDASGDSSRRHTGWGLALSIIATIIGFAALGPLGIVPAIVAGVFAVMYIRLKKVDIPNSLRESVVPVVVVLREEMEPDALLALRFDLGKATRKENHQRSEKLPGKGYPKIEEHYYRNAWISGSGTLADGTALEWAVIDDLRHREVTKKNMRGKIKLKHKYKVRRTVDMRVGMRVDSYAVALGGNKDHGARMSMKEGEKRNVVKVQRRYVMSGNIQPALNVRHFLDTLAGAYRNASLVSEEGGKP